MCIRDRAIDECVKDTVAAAKANDYEVIIIADHGNADHALNEDGTPNTAHSLNPVQMCIRDRVLRQLSPPYLVT